MNKLIAKIQGQSWVRHNNRKKDTSEHESIQNKDMHQTENQRFEQMHSQT
jgi:hypothetical protein